MEKDIRSRYRKTPAKTPSIDTDEFGFVIENVRPRMLISVDISSWKSVLERYRNYTSLFRETLEKTSLIERGIPNEIRGEIWRLLLRPDPFEGYKELYKKTNPNEYQIHVDVQRTFRQHIMFFKKYGKGQRILFQLLVSLANYYPSMGYCQGMGDACAIILMYFKEREAFSIYKVLMERNGLSGLYDRNFSKLNIIQKKHDYILGKCCKKLYIHLQMENVIFSMYATGWYLTLFSRFNIRLSLRIWDFFVFYGFDIFPYFAAGILKTHEICILGLKGEDLIVYVGNIIDKEIDEDIVVAYVMKFIHKLNKKYLQ